MHVIAAWKAHGLVERDVVRREVDACESDLGACEETGRAGGARCWMKPVRPPDVEVQRQRVFRRPCSFPQRDERCAPSVVGEPDGGR